MKPLSQLSSQSSALDSQLLRRLVPICELTADNLRELVQSAQVEELPAGRTLFQPGESDNLAYYLLEGEVDLEFGNGERKSITGGTGSSRFPLDHHRPRQATARTRTPARILRIDNDHLDLLLTWDQNTGYMVQEIPSGETEEVTEDADWMTKMLRSNIFHRIPATNIQAMFMKMEPVPVRKGDLVIRQGDEGDYYYYLKSGKALVTRETKSGKTLRLAELDPGQSFGEEALISNSQRNANVSMLSDGTLMRLGKEDFAALLKEAVLHAIEYPEAKQMVERNEAVWLDVRLESEHKNRALPGSINIPLYLLRIKAREMDKNRTYIVYCDTGRRSSSAAYLLSERGFDAYVLKGGLMAVQQEEA